MSRRISKKSKTLSKKERVNLYLEKQEKERKRIAELYSGAIVVVIYVSCLYLRDRCGYGKKRLGDFVEGFADILKDVDDGWLDINDMMEAIKDETGVEIGMEDIYGN